MPIVRTDSLTRIYGSATHPIYALNKVNLSVEAGEFLAVMGPSGSGKAPCSTCWRSGTSDQRKVYLRDSDLSTMNDDALSRLRRTELGFIFQFYNLIPVLTARENVAMPLILDGVSRAEALKQADEHWQG